MHADVCKARTLFLAAVQLATGCISTEPVVNPAFGQDELGASAEPSESSFQLHVSPILEVHCTPCHSGPAAMGDVDLTTHEGALTIVDPGAPETSKLFRVIADGVMPPAGLLPVADEGLNAIEEWIAAGAKP